MSSRLNRIILDNGTIIDDYQIISLLGQGGYGDVYKVRNLNDGKIYALKTEYVTAPKKALEKEIGFLKELDSIYFPHVYVTNVKDNIMYCVMDLFGKSISDYRKSLFRKTIPMALLLNMGIEMVKTIEAFHKAGYVHRDIKPSNFLFSRNPEAPIVLIDFGLSRRFINPETKEPFPPSPKPHFGGTKKFVSIRLHDRKDSSICDDLQSWFFSMVECAKGRLPWATIRDRDDMGEMKKGTPPEELCSGMPEQFVQLYRYIFSLDYYDVPDYDRIIRTLETALMMHYPTAEVNLNDFYYKIHRDERRKKESESMNQKDETADDSSAQFSCCLIV